MIAITSVSPTHVYADIQQKAINSWSDLGMKCYSFNTPSEINHIEKKYSNVTFVPTQRTMEKTFGKPYVSISAMVDWAKSQDDDRYCFINSDIELCQDKKLLTKVVNKTKSSVVVCNRYDYDTKKTKSSQYVHGIDVFFLNKEHLNIYPPTLFCMGQCFWDYFIPYMAIKNDVEVIVLQNKFAFHKKHKAQYSTENWQKTGHYFIVENDLKFNLEEVGRMNELVFNFLDLTMKKETL